MRDVMHSHVSLQVTGCAESRLRRPLRLKHVTVAYELAVVSFSNALQSLDVVLVLTEQYQRRKALTQCRTLRPHLELSLAKLLHTVWDRLAGVLDEFAPLTTKVVNRLLWTVCQDPQDNTAQRNELTWTSALSSISCKPRTMFSILCSCCRDVERESREHFLCLSEPGHTCLYGQRLMPSSRHRRLSAVRPMPSCLAASFIGQQL